MSCALTFYSFQFQPIGGCTFAGEDFFPLYTGINEVDDCLIVVQFTDDGGDSLHSGNRTGFHSASSVDDFVAVLCGTDDDGMDDSSGTDTFDEFPHGIVVTEFDGMSRAGVQQIQREICNRIGCHFEFLHIHKNKTKTLPVSTGYVLALLYRFHSRKSRA